VTLACSEAMVVGILAVPEAAPDEVSRLLEQTPGDRSEGSDTQRLLPCCARCRWLWGLVGVGAAVGDGNGVGDGRALAGCAGDADGPSLAFDEHLGDVEAEAVAVDPVGVGGVEAGERREQPVQVMAGDTAPVITNLDEQVVATPCDPYRDRGAVR